MDLPETCRPDDHGLFRRTTLLAEGHSAQEIDRLVRTGRLRTVRRGVYRVTDRPLGSPEERHALRCRALEPALGPGAVFGYVSAAVLLGLPVWNIPITRLHVVRNRSGRGQVRAGVHVHGSPLVEQDIVEVDGMRVTSPARTGVDLARSVPVEPALIVLDGILHQAWRRVQVAAQHPGAATAGELDEALGRLVHRRGTPAARRLLALADERSESPGETRSRYAMHRAGLPSPTTQWPVPGTGFRTDFAWPDLGVVGEFDGRVKYGRSARPDEDLREVLWREKRREDVIRSRGLTVVRWTWAGITAPGPDGMEPQLRRHLLDR